MLKCSNCGKEYPTEDYLWHDGTCAACHPVENENSSSETRRPAPIKFLLWLGRFSGGWVAHALTFSLAEYLIRLVVTWHRAYEEIVGFMHIMLWPVALILVVVYVVLAARMRWWTFWITTAAVGLAHGAIFTLIVYFENQPG